MEPTYIQGAVHISEVNQVRYQSPMLIRDDSASVENEEYKDSIDPLEFFEQIRDRNHSMPLNRLYDPNNRFKMFNSNNQLQSINEESYEVH